MLADKACDTDFNFFNSFEKAMPEKSIGNVKIIGKIKLLKSLDMILKPNFEI